MIMSKKPFLYTILLGVFVVLSLPAFSVPAYPYFITMKQNDGEEITLKMRGDERMKWMESEDGYTLLYDTDKNIVYATLDEKGDLAPSAMKAVNKSKRSPEINAELKKIAKGLQYSEKQRKIFLQIRNMEEEVQLRSSSLRSTIGTAKAICALMQFPDKDMTYTLDDFEQLMNQTGYNTNGAKGSVRDFYLENSYGKLELAITVVGPYTAAKNWKYYGENGSGNNKDTHVTELAKEAANFAFNDPSVTPSDYDNDGDGYIDTFHFLYAGYGEESGGGADCIWAHKYGFYPSPLIFQGKRLSDYSCSPELRENRFTRITYIGAICHELCHVFGAPDFYDADGEESGGDFLGTGNWDLMANGSWNNGGATPAHINMYQKIMFGWVDPVELNTPQIITDMPNSAENPAAYIINTATQGEYYVLENRQKIKFDAYVPAHGLLIYHVSLTQQHINYNTVNNGHPQRMYPVYATSSYEYPTGTPTSYGLINSVKSNELCIFPASTTRNSFTDATTPAMRTWNGKYVSKPITEIEESGGLISFKFMRSSLGINLTYAISNNKVKLDWIQPSNISEIERYNIYRDGEFIQSTTQNTYRESIEESGTYIYGVSILYKNGTESAKEEVEVDFTLSSSSIHQVKTTPASIYPNPLKNGEELTVDLGGEGKNAGLFFYDITGRLLMRQQATTAVSRHILHLPQGTYLLKIVKDQETETFKFYIK
jgi:M6 family metalloprotease-like protein